MDSQNVTRSDKQIFCFIFLMFSKAIRKTWDKSKTLKQNFKDIGLAYNVNNSMPVKNTVYKVEIYYKRNFKIVYISFHVLSAGLTIWQKRHMPRAPRFWGPRASLFYFFSEFFVFCFSAGPKQCARAGPQRV